MTTVMTTKISVILIVVPLVPVLDGIQVRPASDFEPFRCSPDRHSRWVATSFAGSLQETGNPFELWSAVETFNVLGGFASSCILAPARFAPE